MQDWTRYQLKRQMFSIGEDFWIENDQGQPIYKVDGKALRIRETFVLEDRNGAELATWVTVKKIPFTFFHQEFEIDVQDGRTLRANGEITNHEYQILEAEQPVATISKQWFALRETYGIAIAPGQDEVLLLATAVCVDELSEEDRKRRRLPGLG